MFIGQHGEFVCQGFCANTSIAYTHMYAQAPMLLPIEQFFVVQIAVTRRCGDDVRHHKSFDHLLEHKPMPRTLTHTLTRTTQWAQNTFRSKLNICIIILTMFLLTFAVVIHSSPTRNSSSSLIEAIALLLYFLALQRAPIKTIHTNEKANELSTIYELRMACRNGRNKFMFFSFLSFKILNVRSTLLTFIVQWALALSDVTFHNNFYGTWEMRLICAFIYGTHTRNCERMCVTHIKL